MKTWAAVLSVVGVALLGCGCAGEESAGDRENAQEEGVTAPAIEAQRCRQVCRSECTFDRVLGRRCREVCRSVCR